MIYYTFNRDIPNLIENPSIFFDNNYEDAWMLDPFIKEIVLTIDKTEIITSTLAQSPIFGYMPVKDISGSSKSLILLYKTNYVFKSSCFGDNCSDFILQISESKDITLCMTHYLHFNKDFRTQCIDTGKNTNTLDDFELELFNYFTNSGDDND